MVLYTYLNYTVIFSLMLKFEIWCDTSVISKQSFFYAAKAYHWLIKHRIIIKHFHSSLLDLTQGNQRNKFLSASVNEDKLINAGGLFAHPCPRFYVITDCDLGSGGITTYMLSEAVPLSFKLIQHAIYSFWKYSNH